MLCGDVNFEELCRKMQSLSVYQVVTSADATAQNYKAESHFEKQVMNGAMHTTILIFGRKKVSRLHRGR